MGERRLDRMWMSILDPEQLRLLLIVAALYVLAFEQFRSNTIDRLKDFFAEDWNENGPIIGEQYKQEVTNQEDRAFWPSLRWHLSKGIIDAREYAIIEECNSLRNRIVHEMLKWIEGDVPIEELTESFGRLHEIFGKIEKWWIVNVEIVIDPQFDNVDIEPGDVIPGAMLGLKMLYDVALGNSGDSYQYLEFLRAMAPKPSQTPNNIP